MEPLRLFRLLLAGWLAATVSGVYGLLLGLSMAVGSWTGKKLIQRLPRRRFIQLVELLLVVAAIQLMFI